MTVSASSVAPLLTVRVAVAAAPVVGGLLGPVLSVSAHENWIERYRTYTGAAAEVQAAMIADGFDPFGAEVAHAVRLLSAVNAPASITWGRRAPADPTWETAIAEILADLAEAEPPQVPAYLTSPVRDESEQIELAKAAVAFDRNMLFVVLTPSVAVRDNLAGSIEKLLTADNVQCAVLYYDAATATGADVASVTTSAGPWAIVPGSSAAATVDGANAEIATVDAARGTRLGSNTEPFNLEPGWVFNIERDAAEQVSCEVLAERAQITSANAEPFALADGLPVRVVIRGVLKSYTVTTGNYADVTAATAAEVAAEAATAFGSDGTAADVSGAVAFRDAKRGTASSIMFAAGTSATFAAKLGVTIGALAQGSGNCANVDAVLASELAAMGAAASGDASCTVAESGKVRVNGAIYGTGGSVRVLGTSTANLLTALGHTAGITAGSGDCADSRFVTAAELYAVLNNDWSTCEVSKDDAAKTVTIEGVGVGAPHLLRIQGGLADQVGIAGTHLAPGSADEHADAAFIGARAGVDHGSSGPFGGSQTWNNIALRGVRGARISVPLMNRLNRQQNVNAVIRWTAARGGEVHDGRLLIRHTGGASAYIDQWDTAVWIAKYAAGQIKGALDNAADGGTRIGYTDPAIRAFYQGQLERIAGVLYRTGYIASVDLEPPSPTKATGLTIVPKAQLSDETRDLRLGEVRWLVELAGHLHGGLVQVSLLV